MKKVLFFAYYFPPTGGAGVQRAVKFVKYLPEFGYQCAVVAGGGDSYHHHLKDDQSLCQSLSCDVFRITLNKSETLQSKLFPSVLRRYLPGITMNWWQTAAKRAMQKAVDSFKPDLIFVTVSPFASAEVTLEVAKRNNIPWVLDMRDPWALDPINYYPTFLNYKTDLRMMHKACSGADAVIMNTPSSLEVLKRTFSDLSPEKLYCITNGWDSEDFQGQPTAEACENNKQLVIVHTGLFHTKFAAKVDPLTRKMLIGKNKNIMDFIRYCNGKTHLLPRTPYYIFKAVKLLLDNGKINKDDLKFYFAGVNTESDKKLESMFGLSDMVSWTGYLSHEDSIKLLYKGDVLFLPLHKPMSKNENPLIVPGKAYEYMASGKAILGLLPDSDGKNFILRSGQGFVCDPMDTDKIAQVVLDLVNRKKSGKMRIQADMDFISQFERRNLTRKLSEVFNLIC